MTPFLKQFVKIKDEKYTKSMKNNIIKSLSILGSVILLSACQTIPLKASKQLRSPDGLLHKFDGYTYYNNNEYRAFKNKLRTFSSKLSESFTSREYKGNENITISPLSIEMCLGLAIYSASGETRQELLDALNIDFLTLNKFYKVYFDDLYVDLKNDFGQIMSQLLLTNSIWLDKNVSFVDDGLDDLRDDYYCYSYQADFKNKNKESCEDIKNFISNKTKGLIKPDIKLSPKTLFVLMNTLYLKDLWNGYGNNLGFTSGTYDFVNGDNTKTTTKLLDGYYNAGHTIQTDDYSSFFTKTERGYKIYFVKPNEGKTIKDVFNQENIDYVLGENFVLQDDVKMESYETKCYFPEFKADSNLDLKQMFIEDFNVKSLFDIKTCSLSNACKNEDVYVSDFVHVAKLDVNKKGIEGAAVTYMAAAGAAGPGPYTTVYETFIVDKEFGFILTDGDDNVLFSGVVSKI